MRPATFKALTLTTALLFGLGISSASAQAPRSYYYPAAGYCNTAAGTVYVPAPGYYDNVPARAAVAPRYTPAYTYTSTAPRYYARSHSVRDYTGGSGTPYGGPAFYSGGPHTLHARGWNIGQHGR